VHRLLAFQGYGKNGKRIYTEKTHPSMIEDPTLFFVLGIGAFWLWIPRLITAVIAVHLFGLWIKMRGKQQSA